MFYLGSAPGRPLAMRRGAMAPPDSMIDWGCVHSRLHFPAAPSSHRPLQRHLSITHIN